MIAQTREEWIRKMLRAPSDGADDIEKIEGKIELLRREGHRLDEPVAPPAKLNDWREQ